MQEEEEVKVLIGPFGHIRSLEGKGCMVVIRLLLLLPLCSSASTFFLLSSFRPPSTYLPTGLSSFSLSLSLFRSILSPSSKQWKGPFWPLGLVLPRTVDRTKPGGREIKRGEENPSGRTEVEEAFRFPEEEGFIFERVAGAITYLFGLCGCEEREESGEEEN